MSGLPEPEKTAQLKKLGELLNGDHGREPLSALGTAALFALGHEIDFTEFYNVAITSDTVDSLCTETSSSGRTRYRDRGDKFVTKAWSWAEEKHDPTLRAGTLQPQTVVWLSAIEEPTARHIAAKAIRTGNHPTDYAVRELQKDAGLTYRQAQRRLADLERSAGEPGSVVTSVEATKVINRGHNKGNRPIRTWTLRPPLEVASGHQEHIRGDIYDPPCATSGDGADLILGDPPKINPVPPRKPQRGDPDWYGYTAAEYAAMMGLSKSVARKRLIEYEQSGKAEKYPGWTERTDDGRFYRQPDRWMPIEDFQRRVRSGQLLGAGSRPVPSTDESEALAGMWDSVNPYEWN
jgi:hypothetical protein